jgi:D-aspartate ligase
VPRILKHTKSYLRAGCSADFDTTVPVLLFRANSYVIEHGTLGVVRSLGRLGIPVYAMVEHRFSPIVASRYLAGSFVKETSNMDEGRRMEWLGNLGVRLSRPAILLPTDDSAAAFAAEHADSLEKWFILPPIPKNLPRRLTDKHDLYTLCKSTGVASSEIVFPQSLDDVNKYIEVATFPVVVKAAESRRLPPGTRSVTLARTARDLLSIYRMAQTPERPNLIFQEYIPEAYAEDWVLNGYRNPKTNCHVVFTGRKFRSFPAFTGITTLGISVVNEAVQKEAEKLLRVTGYAGIMDLDFRLDKRDGQYKLLDFNPRIGANFRMFEDEGNLDVARALHLDLTGRTVISLPMLDHRTFIVETYDLFASVSYIRQGRLSIRSWWQSLKGHKEFAWLSRLDPLPLPVMLVLLALRKLSHIVRTIRAKIAGLLSPKWTRGRIYIIR